jgi:hypothetical protein
MKLNQTNNQFDSNWFQTFYYDFFQTILSSYVFTTIIFSVYFLLLIFKRSYFFIQIVSYSIFFKQLRLNKFIQYIKSQINKHNSFSLFY